MEQKIIWLCPNCKDEEFNHKSIMEHLKNIHGIDIKITGGSREMILHIDSSNWYESHYRWKFNGLKFYQYIYNKRTGKDKEYWT